MLSDLEDTHIITASNLNKKLSFRGYGICAKVFSQGKGSLSHRCSQLLTDLETSPLEQTISWSSSEEDKEDPLQISRPRRTLLSKINFGDCKRIRLGRRRHTSANFVRSIEKPNKKRLKEVDWRQKGEVHDISGDYISQLREITENAPESFNELSWVNILSNVDKKVCATPDSSASVPSSSNSNGSHVPKNEVTEATSPILAGCYKKNLRGRIHKNRPRCGFVKEGCSPKRTCITPHSSSPIFKPTVVKRKSRHKSLKDNVTPVCNVLASRTLFSKKEASYPSDKCEACNFSRLEMSSVNEKNDASLLPCSKNSAKEPAVSPVIGVHLGRRPKPVTMIMDTSISPILGSKSSGAPSRKVLRKGELPNINRPIPPRNVENNFSFEENSDSGRSAPDIDALIQVLNEDIGDRDQCFATPMKANAKRTLHFSPQAKIERKSVSQRHSAAAMLSPQKEFNFRAVERQPNKLSEELNESNFIEEMNTESLDFEEFRVKSVKTHSILKKERNLSLKGGLHSLTSLATLNKKPILDSGATCDPHQSCDSNAISIKIKVNELNEIPDKDSKLQTNFINCMSSVTHANSPNETHLIEEEHSELISSTTSQEVFLSPLHLTKQYEPKAAKKSSISGTISNRLQKIVESEVDIDSCSSQSLRDSQSDKIERILSPCLSSPTMISQSSSPPVQTGGLSFERETDSFNAPPLKGKKKFKQDGLANHLQRLLNRQRSSSRIWQFKRSKQNKATSLATCSDKNSCLTLVVEHTWIEYSHVLVQGDILQGNVRFCSDSSSRRAIVILDPFVAEKLGKILTATQICIFPPWQVLVLNGVSFIIGAYCVEVITSCSTQNRHSFQGRLLEENVLFKNGSDSGSGISIANIIFPKSVEKQNRLFQCSEKNLFQQQSMLPEPPVCKGSISNLVSKHYSGRAFSDGIDLKVFQIFQFRQDDKNNRTDDTLYWSVLAQDTVGETCEVVLGCEQDLSSRCIWKDLQSRNVIGNTYTFSGFVPIQRISPCRASNIWRVISNMVDVSLIDQPVLYQLAASSSSWNCKFVGTAAKTRAYQPQFTSLSIIVPDMKFAEPKRVNILCRVLHASKDRLYIVDSSNTSLIHVITLTAMVYIPHLTFRATILAIFDLEVDGVGELKADKYTRISDVDNNSGPYDKEQMHYLSSLNPTLPSLEKTSSPRTLVIFMGTIVGVDEDSAYMWPACGLCGNELLSLGDDSKQYCCKKCGGQCDNFVLQMSLHVITKCSSLDENSSVRIKLVQSTIQSLLPPTSCGAEGYDMNAVLGRRLGPLKCEVLHVKDTSFVLQEIQQSATYL